MVEPDLDRADEIFRVAFGTFLGAPEPETFFGTADYVRTRWAAAPHAAFAATVEGEVVGSNFAADWGSVGSFGPLTVRPDLWDQGIGRRLMEPVMAWKVVPPGRARGSRPVWVRTNTGVWDGASSGHASSPASNIRLPMTLAPVRSYACSSDHCASQRRALGSSRPAEEKTTSAGHVLRRREAVERRRHAEEHLPRHQSSPPLAGVPAPVRLRSAT
ncbi:GNAT family N-acetyltransferase [Streptomyces griseorubiginosus]|uniref:GNAT family N-acetyltransferase n=1 Tax=Streptomyces griseorubiginosus TaxID=67304 RepID=UPI0033BACB78